MRYFCVLLYSFVDTSALYKKILLLSGIMQNVMAGADSKIAITSDRPINHRRCIMHYSKTLTSKFQKQVKKDFGEDISLKVADLELFKIARLVETLFPNPPLKDTK